MRGDKNMKEPLDQGQYDILEAIERRVAKEGEFFDQLANKTIARILKTTSHTFAVIDTQKAILEYAEPMAQVLAEAAMASQKATGDLPEVAARKWSTVILHRTLELIREKRAQAEQKQIGIHPGEASEDEDQKAP
jgi:hypothetical protein